MLIDVDVGSEMDVAGLVRLVVLSVVNSDVVDSEVDCKTVLVDVDSFTDVGAV